MNGYLVGLVTFLVGLATAASGELLSEEIRDRLDQVPHAVLRLAARRLDPVERATVYDDEWLPGKLRAQALTAASGTDVHHLVLATGVERKSDSTSDWWPLRSPTSQERISDYLFVRRRPGEGFLATPTIMLRREFALACPFPEHLRNHEDYDWLIELEKAGARFQVVLEPLVIVNAPSARTSVSSDAQWENSLAWALSRKSDMSQRAFSDFCLTEIAQIARPTGGLRAEAAVFFVASAGRLSWFSTARFLAICLLPAQARRRMTAKAYPTIGQAATGAK